MMGFDMKELNKQEQNMIFGFRLAMTAATISLADDFAFSEDWINAWTIKTIATAQLILKELPPTEDNLEGLVNNLFEQASRDKPITSDAS